MLSKRFRDVLAAKPDNLYRGLLIFAAGLAVTPMRLVSFFIIIFIAARLLPLGRLGVISRLVLSFGLIACLNGFVGIVFWIFNLPITSGEILTFHIIWLIGLLLFQSSRKTKLQSVQLDRPDAVSFLGASLIAILLLFPLAHYFSGITLARVITAGGDNSTHLEIVKSIDLNHGMVYGYRNHVAPPPGAVNYPQAWHFNVTFLKWITEPLKHYNSTMVMLLFYLAAVFWFWMLAFLSIRCAFEITQNLKTKFNPAAGLVALAVGLPFFGHWLIGLESSGFQAQIGALTLLVLELMLLVMAVKETKNSRMPLLTLAAVVAVSINFMWVFLAPIGFLPLIVVLGWTIYKQPKQFKPVYGVAALILIALTIVQPLMYKLYPTHFDQPMILQRGYIPNTSMVSLVFISILALGYAVWRGVNRALWLCIGFLVSAMAFSIWLYNYELDKVGELRYFYFKSTYTCILLGAIIGIVITYELVAYLMAVPVKTTRVLRQAALLLSIVALAGTTVWYTREPVFNDYLNNNLQGIGEAQAGEILNQLNREPANGFKVGFMGSCNRGDDIRANQLIHSLTYLIPRMNQPTGSFDATPLNEKVLFRYITDSSSRHPLIVVSSDQVLSNKLIAYMGPRVKQIKLINIDTTAATEPISQCPDRARDITLYPI